MMLIMIKRKEVYLLMKASVLGLTLSIGLYPILSEKRKKKMIDKRFREAVEYARKNSPYLAELYKDLPENYKLTDIPPVDKLMMMGNYDRYVTDREVTYKKVEEYMSDRNNRKHAFLGKYEVATTSGSTGNPTVMLFDKLGSNSDAIISFFRNGYGSFPMANLCVDDGFGVDNAAIDQNTTKYPFIKKFIKIIDTSTSYEKMAEELNAFKPKLVLGYVGVMTILADMVDAGKLKIKPKKIVVSGEHLSEIEKKRIEDAFKCEVVSTYACTEAGVMTRMCKCGHFHVNTDMYILEPVDKDNNPVKPGVMSDKTLVTAFSRRVMPVIRYELTDRIIYHDEPCECGSKDPWVEIEGRTNDYLDLMDKDGKIRKISPMVMFDLIDMECGERMNNYQLILKENNLFECRLVEMQNEDRQEVFEVIKKTAKVYLGHSNIEIDMVLTDEKPARDERTGKFRQIYQESKVIKDLPGRKRF